MNIAQEVYTEHGCLWLPNDLEDWLTVFQDGEVGEEGLPGMNIINQASREWLNGTIDGETYFDILAQYGIDPIEHVGEVRQYLDYLMQGKLAQVG